MCTGPRSPFKSCLVATQSSLVGGSSGHLHASCSRIWRRGCGKVLAAAGWNAKALPGGTPPCFHLPCKQFRALCLGWTLPSSWRPRTCRLGMVFYQQKEKIKRCVLWAVVHTKAHFSWDRAKAWDLSSSEDLWLLSLSPSPPPSISNLLFITSVKVPIRPQALILKQILLLPPLLVCVTVNWRRFQCNAINPFTRHLIANKTLVISHLISNETLVILFGYWYQKIVSAPRQKLTLQNGLGLICLCNRICMCTSLWHHHC